LDRAAKLAELKASLAPSKQTEDVLNSLCRLQTLWKNTLAKDEHKQKALTMLAEKAIQEPQAVAMDRSDAACLVQAMDAMAKLEAHSRSWADDEAWCAAYDWPGWAKRVLAKEAAMVKAEADLLDVAKD